MLMQINQTGNVYIEEFLQGIAELNVRFYLSEIRQAAGLTGQAETEEAIRRAMDACRSRQLPLREHFKPVYRCEEKKVILDWKLSELAWCLVMLNANPANPAVGHFQLALLQKKS